MSGEWRWAQADLRRRWVSVATLGVLLALASGATLSLVAGARRAGSATERFIRDSDLAQVSIFTEGGPTSALLDAIAADPRIVRTERSDLTIISPDPAIPGIGGFTAVGESRGVAGGMGTPVLLNGRYPDPGATDEILVNERAAIDYGFDPGQRTTLSARECFECEPVTVAGEVTITGVVRLANDVADDPTTNGLFLAPPDFIDGTWAKQAHPGMFVWLYLADHADALSVTEDLSGLVSDGGVGSNISSLNVVEQSTDMQRHALLIAASVLGLVSVLVLGQAMARFLSVRRVDEPILAALGLTTMQRWRAALVVLAPAVIMGCLVSIPVASALSSLFPFGIARRADPDPGFHIDWIALLFGVAATLLLSGVVASLVAKQWIRRPHAEHEKAGLTGSKLAELGVRPVATTGIRFALERRSGSSRSPTWSALVASVAAMTAVTGALVVRSSIDGLESTPARYGQHWSFAVGGDDLAALADATVDDPRVAAIDRVGQGELNLSTAVGRHAKVGALGIEGVTGPSELGVLAGRAPERSNEIALGTATMRELALHVGDEVNASGACGSNRLTVTGRAIVPIVGGDTPDEGAVTTLKVFDQMCADQVIADIDTTPRLLVRVRDTAASDSLAAELTAQGFFIEELRRPSSVAVLVGISAVTLLLAAMVGALGAAVIAYSLIVCVRRRGKELAVLRAIGHRPVQSGAILSTQALAVVIIAITLGVPLGILVGRMVWVAIATSSNLLARADVSSTVPLAATTTLLVMAVISIWPSWRASRINVATALRSE
ncbi:MAG TPA: FtsX-like permease family protein [Ilumatobacteraceae bacterium]|nr:FtsX-like permease family protein [Ilumatobacteraceae bacterium]